MSEWKHWWVSESTYSELSYLENISLDWQQILCYFRNKAHDVPDTDTYRMLTALQYIQKVSIHS
jgi:hypothetical protein